MGVLTNTIFYTMKILITGGAGFIGSHIAEHYQGVAEEIRVLDNLRTGYKKNLDGLNVTFSIDVVSAGGGEGTQGPPGPQGPAGADGYTPVKGVDYWTAADRQAMVADVIAALPVYNGEVEDV
jgi:hypothetical protein